MNQVHIEPTKFVNVRDGTSGLGFRAWDDEGQAYCNTWEDIPEDDQQFLSRVFCESIDETVGQLADFCRTNKKGVYVGNKYIPWEVVEKLLPKV